MIPTEPCPPEGGRYENIMGRPAKVLAVDLPGTWPLCVAWEINADVWGSSTFTPDAFADEFRPVAKPRPDLWAVFLDGRYKSVFTSETWARQFIEIYLVKGCKIKVEVVRYREVRDE